MTASGYNGQAAIFSDREQKIARQIIKEITSRLDFCGISLEY